jgi:hypothetical protein
VATRMMHKDTVSRLHIQARASASAIAVLAALGACRRAQVHPVTRTNITRVKVDAETSLELSVPSTWCVQTQTPPGDTPIYLAQVGGKRGFVVMSTMPVDEFVGTERSLGEYARTRGASFVSQGDKLQVDFGKTQGECGDISFYVMTNGDRQHPGLAVGLGGACLCERLAITFDARGEGDGVGFEEEVLEIVRSVRVIDG